MFSLRWNLLVVLTTVCGGLTIGAAGQPLASDAQRALPEAVVKAEFVFRFPEFVEWPQRRFGAVPPSVCLSPSHPFRDVLSKASRTSSARPPVRVLEPDQPVRQCDVLYIAPSDVALLAEAASLPILTVGDQPDFCQKGGIINLLVIDGRVRFEVSLTQANRVGLKVDSQLLRLATRVHGGHR